MQMTNAAAPNLRRDLNELLLRLLIERFLLLQQVW